MSNFCATVHPPPCVSPAVSFMLSLPRPSMALIPPPVSLPDPSVSLLQLFLSLLLELLFVRNRNPLKLVLFAGTGGIWWNLRTGSTCWSEVLRPQGLVISAVLCSSLSSGFSRLDHEHTGPQMAVLDSQSRCLSNSRDHSHLSLSIHSRTLEKTSAQLTS